LIALIIIGVILALILIVLLLPINVFLKFNEDFFVELSLAKIKLFQTKTQESKPKQSTGASAKQSEKENENLVFKQGKQLFSFLKEKYGFSGAVKTVLNFGKDVLTHIKKLLRHIKIKRVTLDITVASANAAETAIDYGKICSAAYPVLAILNSCAKIGFKQINIKSDFNGNASQFKFSANISLQIIFLLIAAYRVYSEYKKFVSKENFNERK